MLEASDHAGSHWFFLLGKLDKKCYDLPAIVYTLDVEYEYEAIFNRI